VRLPPAPAALEDGRLRLEPGGVVLGWDYGTKWEYVVFYFPEGLDLEAFTQIRAPSAESIAVLGREGREALVPELRIGGSEPGEPATVLCRARGPAGAALDRVAAGLASRGFQDVKGSHLEGEEEQVVRILEGPGARCGSPRRARAGRRAGHGHDGVVLGTRKARRSP